MAEEHFKAEISALNRAYSSCPGVKSRQEANCAGKTETTTEGCVTGLLLSPGAVFAFDACPEAPLTSSMHKILTTTSRAHVLTGPWAFLLQTQLLPIGEAHFNGKQLLSLTPLPGCCGKSCPDTQTLITQGAYLWLELFFWENPLCQHQGLLGAFYLRRASGEV